MVNTGMYSSTFQRLEDQGDYSGFPRKNRGSLEIIGDILRLCMDGLKRKTHIMYSANLSTKQTNDYLNFLRSKQLILEEHTHKPRGYRITEKGAKYLSKYLQLKQIIDEELT